MSKLSSNTLKQWVVDGAKTLYTAGTFVDRNIIIPAGSITAGAGSASVIAGNDSASESSLTLLTTAPTDGSVYYTITAKGKGTVTTTAGWVIGKDTVSNEATAYGYIPKSVWGGAQTGGESLHASLTKLKLQPTEYVKIPAGYSPVDRYIWAEKADASSEATSASGYSLSVSALSGISTVSTGTYDSTNNRYPIIANNLSVTATLTASTNGWFGSGSATDSDTDNATVGYMAAAGCTVAGGGLSVTANYEGTPTVSLSSGSDKNMSNIIVGAKNTTTYPYFFEVSGSSSALNGTTTVKRANITDAHTAGYLPAKNAATVIAETTSSPTVKVNAGSGSTYVSLKGADISVSGGVVTATAGTASATKGTASTTTTGLAAGTYQTTATSGYEYSISASATGGNASATGGNASITDVKDTRTAGYLPERAEQTIRAGSSKTGANASATGDSASSKIYLIKATASKTDATASASVSKAPTASTSVNGMKTTTTNTGYSVSASAASGVATASVTASSASITAGYAAAATSTSTAAKSATSTEQTASDTKYIQKGVLSASVTNKVNGSAEIKPEGFTATDTDTGYSVKLTTEAGSIKAHASVGTEGYVKNETNTTATTSVDVIIKDNVNQINIPLAAPSFTGGTPSISTSDTSATGTNISITDTNNDNGTGIKIVTSGTARATRTAVNYTNATTGILPKATSNVSASASAESEDTTLATNTYYVNNITVASGKTFGNSTNKGVINSGTVHMQMNNGAILNLYGTVTGQVWKIQIDVNGNLVLIE